jgi:glyoxylase-like metal-dependent hydrolase (beta-lactamase superfamily II)
VTFDQGVTMHFNGQRTDLMFTGGGHTDGDSVVIWPEANVVHMGDLYFQIPGFPFVDVNSGGSAVNLMASLDAVIRVIDSETKVIPGHGPMSNKAELVAYRTMIGDAVAAVKVAMEGGKTREEVIAATPLQDFNRGEGFIGPDAFTGAIFDSLN